MVSGIKRIRQWHPLVYLAIALGLTLVTRVVWVLLTNCELASDFKRYHDLAAYYARSGYVSWPRYTAIFPHTWGYTLALSLVYKLFGASITVAIGFNIVLCLGMAALLYDIGARLFQPFVGGVAAVLWALMPSQIIFAGLVCSEMLHMLLLLAAVDAYIRMTQTRTHPACLLWALACGVLTALSSLIRPLGPILLIAFAMHIFIVTWKQTKPHLPAFAKKTTAVLYRLLLLGILVVSYVAVIKGYEYAYLTPTLNKTAATSEYNDFNPAMGGAGWNLYVGMNDAVSGSWNTADNDVMDAVSHDPTLSATQVQEYFAKLAQKRLDGNLERGSLFKLMWRKTQILWGKDDWIVTWYINHDAPAAIHVNSHPRLMTYSVNGYYYLMAAMALAALVWAVFNKRRFKRTLPIVLILILMIGLVCLHALVEQNARYHYPMNALLCLVAACLFLPKPLTEEGALDEAVATQPV